LEENVTALEVFAEWEVTSIRHSDSGFIVGADVSDLMAVMDINDLTGYERKITYLKVLQIFEIRKDLFNAALDNKIKKKQKQARDARK